MPIEWFNALFGGIIIGFAVSIMLICNGRVTGISGIINGTLTSIKGDALWRFAFIGGLIFGGYIMKLIHPDFFVSTLIQDKWAPIVAGLLVGFGTIMGSGCTSGHGVCGISRMSPRSLVATIVFIFAGVCAVYFFKKIGVLL